MGLNTLLEMLGIGILLPLFRMLMSPDSVAAMPVVGGLFTEYFGGRADLFIVVFSALILVVFLVKNIGLALIYYVQNRVVLSEQAEYAAGLLDNYLNRPYVFHLQNNSADLIRNIQIIAFRLFAKGLLPFLVVIMEAMTAAGILAVLFLVNFWATMGTMLVMGLCTGIFYRLIQNRMLVWGRRTIEYDGAILRSLQQALGAIKATLIGGHQKYFRDIFSEQSRARARIVAYSTTAPNLPRVFIEVVAVGGMLMLLLTFLVIQGRPSSDVMPLLGLFAMGAFQLMPAFTKVVSNLTLMRENSSSVDLLYRDTVIAREARIALTSDAPIISLRHSLSVENVSFSYPGGTAPVLQRVSFSARSGQAIAFVGRSGSGKTTLADIVLGLLDPETGTVRVDGVDVRTNLRSWQSRIGFIPQDIYLLDDTLRRNIAIGHRRHEINEARLTKAVHTAQLEALVAGLPEGLETVVGERGARLSGGQRQRVGIARALYTDPEVLIMDEATSSLDSETEKDITAAIRALAGQVTVIIIAHRLSTIRDCELVVVLEQGRVMGVGSFDELAENNAAFRKMVKNSDLRNRQEDVP